jgi:hypothetical protein
MSPTSGSDGDRVSTNELGLQPRLPILEKELEDLAKVLAEFIQRLSLGVRPGKSRDVAHVETRIRAAFDNGCVGMHGTRGWGQQLVDEAI